MKSLICGIILIAFSSSILAGETLCCDAEWSQAQTEISQEKDGSQQIVTSDSQSHYCNHSNKSDGTEHGEKHQCIGCSHAPFVNLASSYIVVDNFEDGEQYFDRDENFSNPFLDGPFQPPKSNA